MGKRIIWDWPEATHIGDDLQVNENYRKWRKVTFLKKSMPKIHIIHSFGIPFSKR